jgi:assimilatory nitrate reductase catalytic subunit
MQMHGFMLVKGFASSDASKALGADYWVLNRGKQHTVLHMAWTQMQSQQAIEQQLQQAGLTTHNGMLYHDAKASIYRIATFAENDQGERYVTAVAFFAPFAQPLPELTWLTSLLDGKPLSAKDRKTLLLGKPAEGYVDVGRTVCSCFTVGENTIINAIKTHNLTTSQQIGACLKAGTNCGSCVPELNSILLRCAGN